MLARGTVSTVMVADAEISPEEAVKALQAASGYLHKELVHRLDLRKVPFLDFRLDTSIAEAATILSHLDRALDSDKHAPTE